MKEWPTRVRTGVPPFSRTTSGTDQEVIRLWMTVPAAVAGQLAGGDQGRDRGRGDGLAPLVDDEAAVGVAVEGEAEVGALSRTRAWRSTMFFGSSGLASWLGKVPSSSKYIGYEVEGQALEDGGDGVAAHAVARVHDDLERPDAGQVDEAAAGARRSR